MSVETWGATLTPNVDCCRISNYMHLLPQPYWARTEQRMERLRQEHRERWSVNHMRDVLLVPTAALHFTETAAW